MESGGLDGAQKFVLISYLHTKTWRNSVCVEKYLSLLVFQTESTHIKTL